MATAGRDSSLFISAPSLLQVPRVVAELRAALGKFRQPTPSVPVCSGDCDAPTIERLGAVHASCICFPSERLALRIWPSLRLSAEQGASIEVLMES